MTSLFPISTFFRVDGCSYQSPSKRVQITCGVRRQEGTSGFHNLACLDLIRDGAGSLQAFFFLIGSRSIYLESLPPFWPECVFAMNAQAWTVKFEFLQTFAIVWFDMDAKF